MSTYPNIIAAEAARIAELEAALHMATNDKLSLLDQLDQALHGRMAQIDYGCDLQRIIEDLCRGGPIREPKTSARHHYDMAVEALSRTGAVKVLTLGNLQTAHVERQEEWCPDQKPDLSFRGNEMAGEVGEACNVIKKLERERHGWRGSRATKEQLAEELADVVHTAVLCAITAGIDLEPAVIDKFNSTSEKNGLASRLSALELAAPEGQQPVAGAVRVCPVRDAICPHGMGCLYNDGMDCDMEASRADLAYQKHAASYTRPAEQAVTEAMRDLLEHVDRNTCIHEETHRGGFIWTICNSCGQKWADDRGGFIAYSDPEPVANARDALKAAMEAGR